MGAGEAPGRARIHWHIMLTHFPISAFLGAFLFMSLHLLTENDCFTLAAYVSIISGALVMLPTGLTGLLEWRASYKAHRSRAFVGKIWVGAGMTALSAALVGFQALGPLETSEVGMGAAHAVYFVADTLLMLGAVLEGHWGGRLHHR